MQSKSEEPENTPQTSSPCDHHDSNVEDSSVEQFEHSSKSKIKMSAWEWMSSQCTTSVSSQSTPTLENDIGMLVQSHVNLHGLAQEHNIVS